MATSKRSKKRPLCLSLSQSTGLESSRIRKKKSSRTQEFDISDSNSKAVSNVSEEDDNPKRKFVEQWLENSKADCGRRSGVESADECSQDTVILDGNSHLDKDHCDKTEEEMDQGGGLSKEDVMKDEIVEEECFEDSAVKPEIVEDSAMKPEVVEDSAVKPEIVEDSAVKPEIVEDHALKQHVVKDELMESEPGTSSVKETEEEPLLQCPLCWKNFEKAQTQAAHLKACASANGLTTRQLIDAVDLHKKQLSERRKLGLFPMAPPVAAPKKAPPKKAEGQASRKNRQSKDTELELALALSLSLAQREERQESLNAFGFTAKSSGTKKSAPVLLTRTQAERERLITEKISIVLLEESGDSQPSNISRELRPTVQSPQLQEWCNEDHPLWKKTHTSPSQSDLTAFYVTALGNVIAPSNAEVGAKLRHLSQLPGRINTPKKNEKSKEKAVDDSSVSECYSLTNTPSLSKLEQDVKTKHFSDWAGMLKNSSMSDVTVYVRGGLAIPAHKLVLGVRCPQVLHDVTKQQNEVTGLHVDVILWPNISNEAAVCFLEYIYYGSIRSIHTLRKDMSGLNWLANRYEASDLTDVLSYFERRRKRATKSLSDKTSVRSQTPEPFPLAVNCAESPPSLETVPVGVDTESITERELLETAENNPLVAEDKNSEDMFEEVEEENKKEASGSEHSIHSQKTILPTKSLSPDLFSDEYKFALSPSPKAGKSRDNSAIKKLSFDSPSKINCKASDQVDRLSAVSSEEVVSICSVEQSTDRLTHNEKRLSTSSLGKVGSVSFVEKCNERFTQMERISSSNDSSPQRRSGVSSLKTPKITSPTNVIDLSPQSDLPEFNTGSQRFTTGSQRPVFPDDDVDIMIISDGEEEKKPASTGSQKPQDIMSMSNESRLSANTPSARSAGENSPYISPVWNGFDDMSSHFDMGSNWNHEPNERGISPIGHNSDLDETQVRANTLDTLPVRASTLNRSPIRANTPDRSPARGNILGTSPVCGNSRGISPVRGGYQSTSPASANKVYDIPDSASASDDPADRNKNEVCQALLDDSLNAILASSFLERGEKEYATPKRSLKKKGDDSGTESGRVTPMKNYRGMTTSEIEVELEKFGIRPELGKRNGVLMLEHIYNELHPWVPERGSLSQSQVTLNQPPPQRLPASQPSSRAVVLQTVDSSSSSSSSSAEGLSDAEFDDSDSGMTVSQRGTKTLSAADIPDIVGKHIEKDRILHRKILEYEPIFIEHLHSDLKNNGYKFKMTDLMGYLGQKCINYRSVKMIGKTRKRYQQNGNQRKKRRQDSDLDFPNTNPGFFSDS